MQIKKCFLPNDIFGDFFFTYIRCSWSFLLGNCMSGAQFHDCALKHPGHPELLWFQEWLWRAQSSVLPQFWIGKPYCFKNRACFYFYFLPQHDTETILSDEVVNRLVWVKLHSIFNCAAIDRKLFGMLCPFLLSSRTPIPSRVHLNLTS